MHQENPPNLIFQNNVPYVRVIAKKPLTYLCFVCKLVVNNPYACKECRIIKCKNCEEDSDLLFLDDC